MFGFAITTPQNYLITDIMADILEGLLTLVSD